MNDHYPAWTALLYVFNVIVGTGSLTLPKAFSKAGWVFSTILMIILSFISYVTVTFVIEAMSACNAISQWTKLEKMKRVSRYLKEAILADHSSNEDLVPVSEEADLSSTLLPSDYIESFPSEPNKLFTLDRRIELGEMADLMFGRIGRILFYICICSYLYGDLTIYSASVAKSLLGISCANVSGNSSSMDENCWQGSHLTHWDIYRIYLVVFLFSFGPFAFFNVQKTKYLQIVTSITRWIALLVMISIAVIKVVKGAKSEPAMFVPSALPALLGSTVYSFMCHHSLPSMLSPVAEKGRLNSLLALDYLIILSFYLTLSVTAVFAFPHLQDLYTLDFEPQPGDPPVLQVVHYFLTLFPVFTLTATFPIIAVTLRNNLQALFATIESQWFHRIVLPTIAVVPPIILASTTQDIQVLVGVTGSYAGVGIEYIIPALLVVLARNSIPEAISHLPNPFVSPFRAQTWPLIVIGWALLSIVLVTFNIINGFIAKH